MNDKLYIKHSLEYYKLFDDDKLNNSIYHYETYYLSDYAFPNINLIFYNENKKDIWIDRINYILIKIIKLTMNGINLIKILFK